MHLCNETLYNHQKDFSHGYLYIWENVHKIKLSREEKNTKLDERYNRKFSFKNFFIYMQKNLGKKYTEMLTLGSTFMESFLKHS